MGFFDNKKVWVTGGTRGIGRYIVDSFLEQGAAVVTNCRSSNVDNIKKFKEDTRGKNVKLIIADVCKESDVEQVVKYIDEEYGCLDILINNAGVSMDGYIEDYSVDVFRKVLDINVCGKFLCFQKAVNVLKKSRYPSVVNIASRLSVMPMEESVGYCCSQAAIAMMTKVAVLELQKYNIRVNTVSPSLTETELSLSFYNGEQLMSAKQSNPRKRLCTPKDVFEAIKYVCSEEASFVNGTNLHVNGGGVLV